MRQLVVVIVSAVAMLGAALALLFAFRALGSAAEVVLGCRLVSADKNSLVLANYAVLAEIPVYPGSVRVYESSDGSSANNRCLPYENSGPYDSYRTSVHYRIPTGRDFAAVDAFYKRELEARGWSVYPYDGWGRGYDRGDAHLNVRGGTDFWEIVVAKR